MEELKGGREGKVYRFNDKLYRPCGFWSNAVHKLLAYLESKHFNAAPYFYGFDEKGNEILSYVTGEVYNYPLVDAVASNEALISAAVLLRKYHDTTVSFIANGEHQHLEWLLPSESLRRLFVMVIMLHTMLH